MQIRISFYGAFRRLGSSVVLNTQGAATVGDLRNILVEEIGKENKALIYDSVFANDTTILNDGEKILSSCGLSILPPGGQAAATSNPFANLKAMLKRE